MRVPYVNYNKGGYCPLVVGFQKSQFSPSFAPVFVCHQTQTPTLHLVWKYNASQSNNTDGGAQKQIGERQTHRQLLCSWGHCHSTSRLWSDIQQCLQRGYFIPIGDIPHSTCPDSQKCPLMHWKRKINECLTNIFIMCLDFYARWIMRVTCSFMHLHIPTTRSCDYLSLLYLL